MIELRSVSKRYWHQGQWLQALDNIDLTITKGDIFGVLGRSGAGKSTLLRCVNLLERPSKGQVIVDGQDLCRMSLAQLRQARHRIGMIFQHFNLLSARNAYDNVALPLTLMHKPKAEIDKKVTELLQLVGLADRMHHFPHELSGGQKQRVAIARALATDPQVLLCDEATSALDTESTQSILELLVSIRQRLGITILLITHELEVVKGICDHVAVLDHGKMIECGSVVDVFSKPETELARQLLHPPMDLDLPARPEHLADDQQHVFIKLNFTAEDSDRPVITDLIRNHDVSVNIIRANIENIQQTAFGYTVCELIGSAEQVEAAMRYFGEHDVSVEVLQHG